MSDSQTIDLFSPLSPEDIARKLQKIMDDPMPGATARVFRQGERA